MVYRPVSISGDMKERWNILGHRINLSGRLVAATAGVRRNPVETEVAPFAAVGGNGYINLPLNVTELFSRGYNLKLRVSGSNPLKSFRTYCLRS